MLKFVPMLSSSGAIRSFMSTVQAGPLKSHRLILLILLFAASLYLYQLGENSLWLDEFSSIYDAQNLPGSLNPTRPIYYILLRFWMVFGTNCGKPHRSHSGCSASVFAPLYQSCPRGADVYLRELLEPTGSHPAH